MVRIALIAVDFVELPHFLKAHQKVQLFEWKKPFAHRVRNSIGFQGAVSIFQCLCCSQNTGAREDANGESYLFQVLGRKQGRSAPFHHVSKTWLVKISADNFHLRHGFRAFDENHVRTCVGEGLAPAQGLVQA